MTIAPVRILGSFMMIKQSMKEIRAIPAPYMRARIVTEAWRENKDINGIFVKINRIPKIRAIGKIRTTNFFVSCFLCKCEIVNQT